MKKNLLSTISVILLIATACLFSGCSQKQEKFTKVDQLSGKLFGVPTGSVADKLVLSKFPNAKFNYYNSTLDAATALQSNKVDAVAYDEPILKNIAAKKGGMIVLPEMITYDSYGFAVQLENKDLKNALDLVVSDLRQNGVYDEMMQRWLPKSGAPAAMPEIKSDGTNGVLRLGTAAITEPFSFYDGSRKIVGIDIEIAQRVAQQLGMTLEVVDMEFGGIIPALIAGKVDMIAACITITEERAQKVLFSAPYYTGGIAALVRE